jgi:hypothetical protein
MEQVMVTREEFNGLGHRVTEVEMAQARCGAATEQRFRNLEGRQGEQREDIGKIFTAIDELRQAIATTSARMVGVGVTLGVLVPIITALLMFILNKFAG